MGYFVVNPDIIMSHIKEVCEMALKMPFIYTHEEKINKSTFTSSITAVEIHKNQHLLLAINCDDSLLDAVFEKDILNVIDKVTNIVADEVAKLFQSDSRFGFPVPPKSSPDGVIAQMLLKNSSGYIQIILTEIDKFRFSEMDF